MNKNLWPILISVAICLSAAFFAFTFVRELGMARAGALPKINQVSDFVFTDENGQSFGLQDLQGKIWAADFFFTSCGGICPMMTKHMSELARTFDQIPDVTFVSITVNPENDSSSVLKEYAEKYKYQKERWHFLTGNREDITKLVLGSFKLGSIEEPIFHSPHFALVDRQGWIRGYYDGTDSGAMRTLFKDINILLKVR